MKFKLLLLGLVFIIVMSSLTYALELLASQMTDTSTHTYIGYGGGNSHEQSQSFNVSADSTISVLSFYIKTCVTPTEEWYNITIETESGTPGTPSGVLVEPDAFVLVDGSGFVDNGWNNVTLSGNVDAVEETTYVMTLRLSSTFSNGHYCSLGLSASPSYVYTSGDWGSSLNRGAWSVSGNRDLSFAVYGEVSTPSSSPTITNAICTSCISGTNNTVDSTPTINYTLDIAGVACMTNDSTGNYTDCISRGGLCSVAEVNTKGVCTLQESEKLTNYYTPQPLYFFANSSDGVYSLNYNNTIGVTLLGMLSGNVTDSDNNLIEGALVTASLNNTPTVLYNTTSDNIGEWTMNPSIAGIYTVCAYKPKNKTLRGDCTPFVMVP